MIHFANRQAQFIAVVGGKILNTDLAQSIGAQSINEGSVSATTIPNSIMVELQRFCISYDAMNK